MLLADFIRQGTSALETLYPSPEARGMVLMLCGERLGVKNYTHIVEPAFSIPEADLPGLNADMERLLEAEPIQYVLGYSEFCGRRFSVDPAVLIPRPETELLAMELVRRALDLRRPAKILDLCTGSGCLAWTAALDVPNVEVVAVDISEAALAVASGQFAEGSNAPLFVKADVLDCGQDFPYGNFDFIVSNPPYVKEAEKIQMRRNVLDFEPELALFVPDDDALIFYEAIAVWSQRFLVPGGVGLVEINESLGAETAAVFSAAGFSDVSVIPDLSGRDRFVTFCRK